MYDSLIESDVTLCAVGIRICAYGTDLIILIEEYLGLAYYRRKDNVFASVASGSPSYCGTMKIVLLMFNPLESS